MRGFEAERHLQQPRVRFCLWNGFEEVSGYCLSWIAVSGALPWPVSSRPCDNLRCLTAFRHCSNELDIVTSRPDLIYKLENSSSYASVSFWKMAHSSCNLFFFSGVVKIRIKNCSYSIFLIKLKLWNKFSFHLLWCKPKINYSYLSLYL